MEWSASGNCLQQTNGQAEAISSRRASTDHDQEAGRQARELKAINTRQATLQVEEATLSKQTSPVRDKDESGVGGSGEMKARN